MRNIILTLLITVFALRLIAQQTEEDLYALSLEDLLNMTVTGASKKAELVTDAPSIITTITQDEIQKFGGNNLIDVLQRAASFYNISSLSWRQSTMAVRGDLVDELNPHILFMINGRPFRESNKAGLNASLLSTFPLSYIKHIEIIRGPGSVLHGTSAYIAVVNIITENHAITGSSVSLKKGSFNTNQLNASLGGTKGNLQVNGSINALKTDGWSLEGTFINGRDTLRANVPLAEEVIGANLDLAYNGLSLRGFYGKNEMNNLSVRDSIGNLPYTARRVWADIGYADTLIANTYSFSINATLNEGREELFDDITDAPTTSSVLHAKDYLIELTNFYKISNSLDLTFGGTANILSGEEAVMTEDIVNNYATSPYNRKWYRGYLQFDCQVSDWLKVVAGGQLNKVPNAKVNFSPRLALVSNFSSGFGAKVLYGQAFRSPNASENGLQVAGREGVTIVGQEDLQPEVISTFEPQVFYNFSKGNVALNYFYSKQKDLIQREETYANAGRLISEGVELDGKYSPMEKLYIVGSFAYQTTRDTADNKDVYNIPNTMAKLGVSYQIADFLSLGVFDAYYSKPKVEEDTANADDLSDFHWITAKLNVEISELLGYDKPIQLWAESVNVLNSKVYNSVFTKGRPTKSIQINQPERAFYFGISAQF